jgi:predicted DNA-binding protein (UPF0251 family)
MILIGNSVPMTISRHTQWNMMTTTRTAMALGLAEVEGQGQVIKK